MIVADASALIAALLSSDAGARVRERLRGETVAIPHLADLEVLSALRRQRSRLPAGRLEQALEMYRNLALVRFDHSPHLRRIWQLEDNLTAYDAAYVALAEALVVPLVTMDTRLANTPGAQATVEVIA
jgi:predicted nucleic acid-binding protein